MSSPRARRLFLGLLALPVLFLLFLYQVSHAPRSPFSGLFSPSKPPKLPDEIFGLLHFVTSPDEAGRLTTVHEPTHDGVAPGGVAPSPDSGHRDGSAHGAQLGGGGVHVAPERPVAMAWYALGSTARAHAGWDGRLKALREHAPLVVFSKTYCPYSKRAKTLLETYDLSPAPKIVEVDLRADASHIKTFLTRLTHRTTFPNVILHGRSLGGSDELVRLHEEDKLRPILEKAGIKVGWTGEGGHELILH